MAFFDSIRQFFSKLFTGKNPPPKNDWLETYNTETAKPKNPTPLDPSNPWIT